MSTDHGHADGPHENLEPGQGSENVTHDIAHDEHGHHNPYLAHHFDTPEQQYESGKLGMWVFLATEILMFGGLFCAYAIYRGNHPEVFLYAHHFLDTFWGAFNTFVLIASSLTMAWAVRCAQLGQKTLLLTMLIITLLGGFGFMLVKTYEYNEKWDHAVFVGAQNAFYTTGYGTTANPESLVHAREYAEGEHGGGHGEDHSGEEHQGDTPPATGQQADPGQAGQGLSQDGEQATAGGSTPGQDQGQEQGQAQAQAQPQGENQGSQSGAGSPPAQGEQASGGQPSGAEGSGGTANAAGSGSSGDGGGGGGQAVESNPGGGNAPGTTQTGSVAAGAGGGPEGELSYAGIRPVIEANNWAGRPSEYATSKIAAAGPSGLSPAFTDNFEPSNPQPTQQQHASDGPETFDDLSPRDQNLTHIFFQIYFLMTGLHGIHVLIGMGLILWILYRSGGPSVRSWLGPAIPASLVAYFLFCGVLTGSWPIWMIVTLAVLALVTIGLAALAFKKLHAGAECEFGPQYFIPVDLVGLYWHLVDLIWIFLFPLLYLIH